MFRRSRAPELLVTQRLTLRRPAIADAQAIFESYSADQDVTRFLGWRRHRSIADTQAFLQWSDEVWAERTVGPYVVLEDDRVIGSTGLELETPWRAMTGFLLARQDWGRGLATEIARAMAELAEVLELARLYALCHPDNVGSARVLARAGFVREGVLRRHTVFPNMAAGAPQDVECWARVTR